MLIDLRIEWSLIYSVIVSIQIINISLTLGAITKILKLKISNFNRSVFAIETQLSLNVHYGFFL